jgi:hypothetical protein
MIRDHSKSYPNPRDLCSLPWGGLAFRMGYGWVAPYNLPYSLDGQLPEHYLVIDTKTPFSDILLSVAP